MLQGPGEGMKTWRGLLGGVKTIFTTNPLTTIKAIWDGFTKPMIDAWKDGKPGEAFGRGVFEILLLVFGTKGLDKLKKLRPPTKLDDLAKTKPPPKPGAGLPEPKTRAGNSRDLRTSAGQGGSENQMADWTNRPIEAEGRQPAFRNSAKAAAASVVASI